MDRIKKSDKLDITEYNGLRPNVNEEDPPLVDMFLDLMETAGRITTLVNKCVAEEVRLRGGKYGKNFGAEETFDEDLNGAMDLSKLAEELENDQIRDGNCSESEENDFDDDEVEAEPIKEDEKINEQPNQLEQLLDVLQIHKSKQLQNVLIKKAILCKFEEKLFGNNNMTMQLDLRSLNNEESDGKLENLLGCRNLSFFIDKEKFSDEVIDEKEGWEKEELRGVISQAEKPLDILHKLKKNTPKNIPIKMMMKQYNIRWNTLTGESKPYDFFSLPQQFIKGTVRKTYMQTVLYHHKNSINSIGDDIKLTQLCPPVVYHKRDPYRKQGDGSDSDLPIRMRNEPKYMWKKWSFNKTEQPCKPTELGPTIPAELSWISPVVRLLIRKLCEPLDDEFTPENTENVMYMLVVEETISPKLPDTKGFKSQVYIGGADAGLREKFLGEDGHCAKLMEIKKHFSDIEYFKIHQNALLIELRLFYALLKGDNYALFAINNFDDPRRLGKEVHEIIGKAMYLSNNEVWGPTVNMHFGLNLKEEMKKKRKFLPDSFPGSKRRGNRK